MNGGWISVKRSVIEHDVVGLKKSGKYSKFEAWIWLLLRANYENARCCIGNQIYELKKGQMIVSQKKMRLLFGWSNSKLINYLKLLQKDNMIELETTNKMSIITILNYRVIQDNQHQKNIKNTSKKHQKNTINKNSNKNNNKEINYFNDWWNLYNKKVGKTKAQNYWIKNIKAKQIEDIMKHTEKYVKIRTKQYRKNPQSYLLNKTWEDEIIENLTDFVDESLKEKERIVQRRYEVQMQQMKKEKENAPTDNEWDNIRTTLNDWKK